MKKRLAISINPTYACNLDCSFCYLKDLHDKTIMDLDLLEKQLEDISQIYEFVYIDLYGGEITILPEDYINRLISIIEKYTSEISLVTNLIKVPEWLYRCKYQFCASWDYIYRPKHELVLKNCEDYYNKTGIGIPLVLTSPDLYKHKEIVRELIDKPYIKSFDIKPCMKTSANGVERSLEDYENLVKYFIENPIKPFFTNSFLLNNKKDRYLHIFINPYNKFVDVKYDDKGNERFEEVNINSLNDNIPIECTTCEMFEYCQNEHCNIYLNDGYDCYGLKKLLQWRHNAINN